MRDKRRWSGNDKHFGPLTYCGDKYKNWAIVIDSGNDESIGCCLRLQGFGGTLILELPAIIKPWRRWVDTSKYEWSTGPNSGFWDEHKNEYGFCVSDGFLQVFLGPQTGSSETTRNWCKFLPWTQWRHHRISMYGIDGGHFWTEFDSDKPRSFHSFDAQTKAKEACPFVLFEFDDYDGERITAKTIIEEREWLFGEGWFKWLSRLQKPMVKRTLDIEFSKEVGSRKGSWKGGTIGHGIEMLPDELHEHAFRRYCDENNMTFAGTA